MKNDRLIILNTSMRIKTRSHMCLIGNGRRFYVPEARERYHP